MKYMTSEEFYSALESNEYGRQYLELIEKVQSEHRSPKVSGDKCDRHHIHPKALGGENSELIKLTAFEHCQAHVLLAKAIPCLETLFPVKQLSCGQIRFVSDLDRITLEEVYGWSEVLEEWRLKNAKACRGRKRTLEQRQQMSERRKGKPTWNKGKKLSELGIVYRISEQGHQWLVETGQKRKGCVRINNGVVQKAVKPEELQSYLDQGYVKGSLGTSQKGSIHIYRGNERKMISPEELDKYLAEGWERGRGNPTWNYGRVPSEETRRKMSEKRKGRKASDDLRKRQSEAKKGRIHIYKNTERKMIKPEELEHYLAEGWTQGRLFNKHIQESLKK